MAERFTKPGTANVSPADRKKLAGLLKHYRAKAHPFKACYRDQIKHGLTPDHAARRCAVLKDLIHGGTGWRKGGKKRNLSVSELRDIVDLADASGLDCDQLKAARRVLELAEQREAVDMATVAPPAAPAKEGLISYRITRGPRKGQVVQGRRGKDGTFYEVRVNTAKGNPRAGRKFLVTKDSKGRTVHVYNIGGKRVPIVVKPKKGKR